MPRRDPWTQAALSALGNKTYQEIADMIGVTKAAVAQKHKRLGIPPVGSSGPRPTRGEHAKTRTIRLTDSDLEVFERMSAGKGWRAWAAGVLRKAAGLE